MMSKYLLKRNIVCYSILTKGLAELVLSDGTEVGGTAGDLEHPLSNTDGVQGSTASNVLHGEVGDQLLVQRNVLLLSQDGVVKRHVVLLQELSRDLAGNIQQRVAHAKDGAFEGNICTHVVDIYCDVSLVGRGDAWQE